MLASRLGRTHLVRFVLWRGHDVSPRQLRKETLLGSDLCSHGLAKLSPKLARMRSTPRFGDLHVAALRVRDAGISAERTPATDLVTINKPITRELIALPGVCVRLCRVCA